MSWDCCTWFALTVVAAAFEEAVGEEERECTNCPPMETAGGPIVTAPGMPGCR